MERFSVFDHLLLSRHNFDIDSDIVHNLSVEHKVDNCSDHDLLFRVLNMHVSQIDLASRILNHCVN
jgi:hypothetical protein